MSKSILVTGGAGYIGSHTVLQLLQAGFASSLSITSTTPPISRSSASRSWPGVWKEPFLSEVSVLIFSYCLRMAKEVPCTEESPFICYDPYGRTKLIIEDICQRYPAKLLLEGDLRLQYMELTIQPRMALGIVRDYIHVVDLADGHIAALQKLFEDSNIAYNLGTGKGTPVLEMVAAFEKASGKKIPLVMAGRRPGDAAIVYASTAKAEKRANWKTNYG
uniref:UDP-glucose 4-epimerase n=1 Tax=Ananas comosus var. bracteatus TaxID=296719 RepID=A0A6V7PUU8_ANACO|nr:unnamed protein product [Ananas comosus var. bracteatus]